MSLEQSIADLQTQAGLLLDLPQTIADAATAKINQINATYQGLLANGDVSFYVNQATGADTNAGTIASPFKTIQKALSMVPRAARCRVFLQADYVIDQNITISGRHLVLASDSSVKRQITFERYNVTSTTPVMRACYGFRLGGSGSLLLSGLTINFPALDGSWGSFTLMGAMIGSVDTAAWQPLNLVVFNCDVVIPATPFAPFIATANLTNLMWFSNTLTGAVTSVNGRLFGEQTNTAGVASNTISQVVTNLATI